MKMKKETLQRLLGSRYKFEQYLNAEEVEVLKRQAPEDFFEREAAALTAGYVEISAVLFRLNGSLRLGYDVLVRDRLDAPEWVCYDNPEDEVKLEEEEMLAVLDRVVRENGLSYTENSFRVLKGKNSKPV